LVKGRDHQTQIWFSGFGGDDLNVIFYQNMPNFQNGVWQLRSPAKMAATVQLRCY
jgi:hypothetical protein